MATVFQRIWNVFQTEGPAGLRTRLKQRAWRRAFKIARRLDRPTFLSAYGIRMVSVWNDTTFRYCAIGAYGEVLSSLIERQSSPFCFLDIGANQGLYTILAARNPLCERAYAFEPVPHTADLLARNIELNKCENRCKIMRQAISDSTGSSFISIPEGHSGAASLMHYGDQNQKIEIETIDGDALARILQDETAPFLIKLDVEGYEAVVVDQLLSSPIADRIACIFYECDERWIDTDDIQAKLTAAGFEHFERLGEGYHYDVLASRDLP